MTNKDVMNQIKDSIDKKEMNIFLSLEARQIIYKALNNIERLSKIIDIDAVAKEARFE